MKSEEFAAHADLLTYVLQDYVHNRLTPRVVDIAYTAFRIAKRQNDDDGGPTDWFNDTKPTVMEAIDKLRKDLMEDRAKQSGRGIEPVNNDCAATGQSCGCVPHGEPVAWHSKQYGVVWMAVKPGNLVAGTRWFIQGRQEPVAEVVSPVSLVWHVATSELEHGTVFYTAPQPPQIPEGYKLVPIEPTDKMLGAALRHIDGMACMPAAYKAMLEAAREVKE